MIMAAQAAGVIQEGCRVSTGVRSSVSTVLSYQKSRIFCNVYLDLMLLCDQRRRVEGTADLLVGQRVSGMGTASNGCVRMANPFRHSLASVLELSAPVASRLALLLAFPRQVCDKPRHG